LKRQIITVLAGLVISLASPALAQQPLAEPPTKPLFFPQYDFHLWAAALANDNPRFSWDTHFGGEIDIVDYVRGRAGAAMDYEAVLGSELRAFDPNQGNYTLELSSSYRIKRTELAGIFHHVSRHLSDRPKTFAIAWNILGLRVLREAKFRKATVDLVADVGRTTQSSYVDYRWAGNADLIVRQLVAPRAEVYGRGVGHLMTVDGSLDLPQRRRQTGGIVEGGVRLIGEKGIGELFVAYERRFDAYPIGFAPERWFMAGFRLLRR